MKYFFICLALLCVLEAREWMRADGTSLGEAEYVSINKDKLVTFKSDKEWSISFIELSKGCQKHLKKILYRSRAFKRIPQKYHDPAANFTFREKIEKYLKIFDGENYIKLTDFKEDPEYYILYFSSSF